MDTAAFDQDAFAGRCDNGSESGATWKQADGGCGAIQINGNWTQLIDDNFRVRFVVQETAGFAENNFKEDLQYQLNGGGWNDVDDSTSLVVRMFLSGNFAHGDDTTQQVGAGTFITDNDGMNETNPPGSNLVPDFVGNDETEFEFCVQIRGVDVSDGDTVELRVTNNGTPFGSYTNTPSITVSKPPDTGWLRNIEQPLFARLRLSDYTQFAFWPEPIVPPEITLDRWFRPAEQPLFSKPRLDYTLYIVDADQLAQVELRWRPHYPDLLLIKVRLPDYGFYAIDLIAGIAAPPAAVEGPQKIFMGMIHSVEYEEVGLE